MALQGAGQEGGPKDAGPAEGGELVTTEEAAGVESQRGREAAQAEKPAAVVPDESPGIPATEIPQTSAPTVKKAKEPTPILPAGFDQKRVAQSADALRKTQKNAEGASTLEDILNSLNF